MELENLYQILKKNIESLDLSKINQIQDLIYTDEYYLAMRQYLGNCLQDEWISRVRNVRSMESQIAKMVSDQLMAKLRI